ncbi:hypothetical protein A9490_24720 [Bacillus thuringiensis]|uniref:hypothetical protein n=1 Tax=Bacillus thuringiensis TaxID=1428 RepID=UPI0008FE995D|nr:hypothetical protein [Bacillus thuringiensis]OJE31216.1 hypothetical protein A9490_24720 [Bacillus thuringiensis]
MTHNYNVHRDRSLMIILFLYSLISFGILQLGFIYLKDFLLLIAMMKVASGMAFVISMFSFLGIISTSWLIKETKTELEKEKNSNKT